MSSTSKVDPKPIKQEGVDKIEFKVPHNHDVTFWTPQDFVE